MKTWNQDGEFMSRRGEHIPISRLLDAVGKEEVSCTGGDVEAADLLQHIYALQVLRSRLLLTAVRAVTLTHQPDLLDARCWCVIMIPCGDRVLQPR